MRNLKTEDIFRLSAIIRKLNLKKELTKIANGKDISAELYGAQLFLLIFENMDQAEEEICEFFADIAEMPSSEFRTMGIEKLGQFIYDLRSMPGVADFFYLAFKTTKEN